MERRKKEFQCDGGEKTEKQVDWTIKPHGESRNFDAAIAVEPTAQSLTIFVELIY